MRARAPIPWRPPLFDPARVPAPVLRRLATVGYWQCPAELREKVDRWAELDEIEAAVAENDLSLIASALTR